MFSSRLRFPKEATQIDTVVASVVYLNHWENTSAEDEKHDFYC